MLKSHSPWWVVIFVACFLLAAAAEFVTKEAKISRTAYTQASLRRELKCLQRYRTGNIEEASEALRELLDVLKDRESSGIDFHERTAAIQADIAIRLSNIYGTRGETNLQKQLLQEAIAFAKLEAKREHDNSTLRKSDQEIGESLIAFMTAIEKKNPPAWTLKTEVVR